MRLTLSRRFVFFLGLAATLVAPAVARAQSNPYVTVAQLNFWFRGPGCNGGFEAFDCSGLRNTNLTPALGSTYDEAQPQVIGRQINWAINWGVDAFSIEWTTPREIQGSMEEVLDDVFLKAPQLPKVRWCLFYDLVLRLQQTPGLTFNLSQGMDFNQPDVYDTFVSDIDRFAEKYFSQAQYLKIDDRPVVYVWGTWNALGPFKQAVADARAKAAARGFDVYLVGDVIRVDQFVPDVADAYDANTNFVFFVAGSPAVANVGKAAPDLDTTLTTWENWIANETVFGRTDHVILQPGFTPQFDNTTFLQVNGLSSPTYIPANSRKQVAKMARVVRNHAHGAGTSGTKLVWINTWNNWPETTTVEPTAPSPPKYPAGNYGYDMLKVIRGVFGPETF
jgi:Glycosyltransferase WbsX